MDGLLGNERELLARMIQAEAGNQGETGMRAVASVMDNRRRAQGYGGNTFTDVLLAPGQFSPANSITGYAGGEQGVDLNRLQPSETAYTVADTVMSGGYEDPTGGALNFLNPDISQPSWMSSMQNAVKIGDHLFGTAGSGEGVTGQPGGTNMQRQPQGLLGNPTISTQGRAPQQAAAQEEERKPFFQRPGVANVFDTLAMGLQGMTLNPNQALMSAAQDRIQQRREMGQMEQQRNRTADWLESQGLADLAQGVRSGALGARDALTMARGSEATSKQRDYQYLIQQGIPPEQAVERVFGGSGVNVSVGGERETAFEKEVGKNLAGMATEIVQQGSQATQTLTQLGALEKALSDSPQGAQGAITIAAGNLGIPMEGLNEAQAAQAIINRLVPQQRPAGSGPMSDADLELFKQSLPRIINQPEGNQRILSTMKGIAEYDRKRGEIAARLLNGEIQQAQALQQLNQLSNPLDWVRNSGGQGGATGGNRIRYDAEGNRIND